MADRNEMITLNNYGRTSWNKEAYAEEALAKRKGGHDQPAPPEKAAGTVSSQQLLQRREKLLEQVTLTNTAALISDQTASAANSKRGKGIGFYCDACDLTFKDDYQFITHLNHPAHLKNIGFDEDAEAQREVSLVEVKDRLAMLKRLQAQKREADGEQFHIHERIQKRQAFEAREAERRKARRKLAKARAKASTNQARGSLVAATTSDSAESREMALQMGFTGFHSTKS